MDRSAPFNRFFAGLAETTFQTRLGVADPPLIDYLTGLLIRFIHSDTVYKVRDLSGRRLGELADMLAEAEHRVGEARREVHRHVGDFALFWTGLYPEALHKLQAAPRKDCVVDYMEQGKRAYFIASTIPGDEEAARSDVLLRLSDQFELCAYGLGEVRRELESQTGDDAPPFLLN